MFKHILVPTDGSELSNVTVKRAVTFAQETGARITFFFAKPDYPIAFYGEGALIDPTTPEKFAEMAKSNNSELSSIDTKTIAEQARQTLIYRLMLGQWSPSGEAFAFAGEMYGPSTDLYLYNVKTDNFQRLSSGSRDIDFIKWFPNGEKILYGSSYLPCLGDCSTYFVTSLDGLDSKELQGFETFGGSTKMGDWFGDEFLTMYTTANVSGDCCLRNYD